MKVAFVITDDRETDRGYNDPEPRFATGSDSLIQGCEQVPEIELHVIFCTKKPVATPEKMGNRVWLYNLHVPQFGWLRTGYQGCIRAVRRKVAELKPDIVHGVGTERDCAMSAVFSGFPNVVSIAGNMAELARIYRPRFGTYGWVAARLENFTLPRTGGVICNSRYTDELVRPRAKKTWIIYPGLRKVFLQPPTRVGPRECAVVVAGVITRRKRQLELLKVAEELHRRGLKCEFRFAGFIRFREDPYAIAFLDRIKAAEQAGFARYLGAPSHRELVEALDRASGMVHFPTEEAFGSVVAEGFARGAKLFGARTGGIVEIAEGMPGAELFDREDWAGLTSALERWIGQGCPAVGGTAEEARRRYDPALFVRRHLEVYKEVVAGCRLQVAG